MATLYNQYIYKNGAWMKIGTSSDSVTYTLSYSALTGLLTLTGSDGSTSTVTIDSGSSDAITGITVNGTTVTVTDGVAAISIPTNVSAFTNDAGYITTPAFKITVTENNGTYTADKTYAEISQAINNGYICYVTDGIYNYYYTFAIEGYFYFEHSTSQADSCFYISSDSVLYSSNDQFGTIAQNMVLASPSNQSGIPYFRALVASDIPDLSSVYSTTDEKVKQINTTSGTYSILLGNTYSAGTVTSSVNKAQLLSYNVSSNRLNVNNIQVGSVSQSGTIMLGGVALIGAGSSSGLVDNTVTLPAATGTIALAATTLAGYGITDAYTKTQVDGLVSGVLHYKGTKATTSALPSSGNTTGDVWHVTADGSEWAWDGSVWQELGTAIDLSGYVQTSTTINNKALTGNITLSASDVGALPSSTVITDQNVLQTPVNNNSTYGLTLSTNTWQAATDSVYTTDYVSFALDTTNSIGQLRFRNSDDSAYTWIQNRALGFVDNDNQLEYTYTLPNKSGTVAMISDIDGTWNGVSFNKSSQLTNQTIYIPYLSTVSATEAKLIQVIEGSSITGHAIPKYDNSGYLYSTTPTATDNTKKVATTAFIQTALSALTADDISVSNSPLSFDYTGNTYTLATAQDELEALVTEIDSLADALDTRLATEETKVQPIALGGTGATAKGNAFLNVSSMEYTSATDFNDIRLPGVYAINPSTTPTNHPTGGNDYGQLFVICANQNYSGEWSMTLQIFTKLFGDGIYVRSYANQSWRPWHKMKNDVPSIVRFYISKSSYSRSGYSNLQITTRTNISGDTSFTSANTDYWNIQLDPGTYRMNLYCSFQSSSAVTTDVGIGLGDNANRRPTPIEARVQTTGSLTKLNASGILKVTSYSDLYSFLIYMGNTTARDIEGYWTIERIGQ